MIIIFVNKSNNSINEYFIIEIIETMKYKKIIRMNKKYKNRNIIKKQKNSKNKREGRERRG